MQRRVVRFCSVAVAGILMAGCYTFQPVMGTVPDVGKQVAFDINDAGRVALGRAMGPEIGQVEGTLLEKDNGSYLMAVSTVRLLRGAGEQVWSGEQIRLQTEHVGPAYERRFSTGRSIGLGAVFVGAFTGFMLSRSLIGLGNEGDGPDDPPGGEVRLGRP
jgi:hypothetical protein